MSIGFLRSVGFGSVSPRSAAATFRSGHASGPPRLRFTRMRAPREAPSSLLLASRESPSARETPPSPSKRVSGALAHGRVLVVRSDTLARLGSGDRLATEAV